MTGSDEWEREGIGDGVARMWWGGLVVVSHDQG